MRLSVQLNDDIRERLGFVSNGVQFATKRAVKKTTLDIKDQMRAHISARLSARAGYLVRHRFFDDNPSNFAGLIYSKWRRRGGAASTPEEAKYGADILAAFETGKTILPTKGRFLIQPIGFGPGRGPRRQFKRYLDRAVSNRRLKWIPISGGRYLLVDDTKRGKRRGDAVAIASPSVRIPKKLNLAAITGKAQNTLRANFVRELEAAGV